MHRHNDLKVLFISLVLLSLILSACQMSKTDGDASSNKYEALVALFEEFREFQKPTLNNWIPDYSAAAMKEKARGLKEFQERLTAIDISTWPVSQKVDYHLVRAEMNGLDFYLRVLKPWSRDPVFYLPSQGGAGPVIDMNLRLRRRRSLDMDSVDEVREKLKAIPKIYEQAKTNLTEAAGDMADIAIHVYERDASMYLRLAAQLAEDHPDLVDDAKIAAEAVEDYGKWLKENKHKMTAPGGIGIENYNWWLKNVHLFPYTWQECKTIVEHEYSRIITFLKLEEHRNRKLPPLEVADTSEKYYRSMDQALNYVVEFLRDEEILTVPDWLNPADYSDPSKPRREFTAEDFANSSIDLKARQREILPGETHEFIGHLFDGQREERDKRIIRSARRLYNMGWIRSEGWAAGSEELLMQAGVLDKRPRRGREIEYLMNASHMSLSIPDLKMHSNEITFAEARKLCAEIMPYEWSQEDERMVWYEQQSNLRFPGFHTGVVVGKAQFTKLFKDRAMQLGKDFVLRDFMDEFLAAGVIPMSLIRWEMTGFEDEIKELW